MPMTHVLNGADMMDRTGVIELAWEEREDGSLYLHSPTVPLFHVVAENRENALSTVLPMLQEHLERNLRVKVTLEIGEDLRAALDSPPRDRILPPHIIARMVDPSARGSVEGGR